MIQSLLHFIESIGVTLYILAPWSLGYALVRTCLKKRYGYQWIAIGVGYLIGLSAISAMTLHYFATPKAMWVLTCFGLAMLIYIVMPPKPCFVGEQRAELPTPTWQRMLMLLLSIVLLLIFLMAVMRRWQHPVIAQDVTWTRVHHYFSQNVAHEWRGIWWWLLYPALSSAIYGVLRYAQCARFVAFLGMFGVMTVPVFAYALTKDITSLWTCGLAFIIMVSLAHEKVYREWRQIFLFFLAAFGIWFAPSTSSYSTISSAMLSYFFTNPLWGIMGYAFVLSGFLLMAFTVPIRSPVYRLAQTYLVLSVAVVVILALYQQITGKSAWHYVFYVAPMFGLLPPLTYEACRFKPALG